MDRLLRLAGGSVMAIFITGIVGGIACAHELPVGDGHVTGYPKVGNVYSCQTEFRGGGARHTGDWFHGDTWNPLEKPHVEGRVMWPQAALSISQTADAQVITGNSLPIGEPTGEFPISPRDPAYKYDTNPNPIQAQALDFEIPLSPRRAATPGCLPMGMIGFTVSGVAIYSALDDAGRDAAAHEVQDLCDGHPQGRGQYHYHSASPCIPGIESNQVVGWALDGYPILGMQDAQGRQLSNADLDACHGRAEAVSVNGHPYRYAYRFTREYPYTLGCFTGDVLAGTQQSIREGLGSRRQGVARGPGGRGDGSRLSAAAEKLGVSVDVLRRALGPPPPDLAAAATTLGVSEAALRAALRPATKRH